MPKKNPAPSTSDLIELLSSLVEEKIRFLIVGGYAVAKHGFPRYTKDVDIWIDNSLSNANKVYLVLKHFGAPVSSISPDFFSFEDHFLKLGREPLRVDIICGMEALDFKSAWKNRVRGNIFGVKVNFISVKDLIILKKHANRPQDLADIAALKQLK
jgi:predicted nucleotidyltransferase